MSPGDADATVIDGADQLEDGGQSAPRQPTDREPDTPSPAAEPSSQDEEPEPMASWPGGRGKARMTVAIHAPIAVGFWVTLGCLIALMLGTAISQLSTVLVSVVLALFVALGLDPLVRGLEARGVRRVWGIALVYAAFTLVIAGMLTFLIPIIVRQVGQFFISVPRLIEDFTRTDLYGMASRNFGGNVPALVAELQKFITNPSNLAGIGGGVLQVSMTIATTVSGLVIVLVLSLYFLAAMPTIRESFIRLMPARNRERGRSLSEQIAASIGGYLTGMVVLAFFNAVAALILYAALGLPFPMLMAAVAFFLTMIPLVGSMLFWGIASILALFTSPVSALIFAIVYLVYMQIEAYVFTPRVMNKTISVPGSLVLIGALVGGTLLGLLGALIAMPVTAAVLMIVNQIVIPRQDAKV